MLQGSSRTPSTRLQEYSFIIVSPGRNSPSGSSIPVFHLVDLQQCEAHRPENLFSWTNSSRHSLRVNEYSLIRLKPHSLYPTSNFAFFPSTNLVSLSAVQYVSQLPRA